MKRAAACLALPTAILLCLGAAAAAASGVPTSRPVGLRVIERADAARATKRFPHGRPVQICLWYPAASGSPAMTYRDYVVLAGRETSFGPADPQAEADAAEKYRAFLSSAGIPPQESEALLATKMRASRDADPAPGRFPLVLIAPGNGDSVHDQAFLAERLAARGFAVAAVPSQSRIDGPMTSERDIPDQAEAQATDLALALRTVRFESSVRPGRFGVVGHSFGARSALLLAMTDPDAAAVVSLDGGIGGKAGKGFLEKARAFRPARATAPILHLYEEGDRRMVPDFDLLRSLRGASRWLVKVDDMAHAHFSSVGVLVRTSPALFRVTSARERTAAAWDAVFEATASFLDQFVAQPATGPTARASGGWSPPASPLLHVTILSPASPPERRRLPAGAPAVPSR